MTTKQEQAAWNGGNRRTFTNMSVAATAAAIMPLSAQGAESEAAPAKAPMSKNAKPLETDVLVVGGGTAGVIAALQAARAGASTILLESGSQLGGTTTTAGVAFPGLFQTSGDERACWTPCASFAKFPGWNG